MPMGIFKFSAAMATAAMACVSLAPNRASATAITVLNPSFEQPAPPYAYPFPGGTYSIGGITDWTGAGGQFGQQTAGDLYSYLPDGVAFAYTNGGSISQTVGATAIAGDTYTLTVDVGTRSDGYNGPVIVDLIVDGIVTAALGSYAPSGTWSPWTATFTASAADAGGSIAIDLISNGGPQADFDNVQLNSTAAPLPATLPLLASSLLMVGLFGWRSKRKNAAAAAAV
jgi:hypothetical protein